MPHSPTRFIQSLDQEELEALRTLWKESDNHRVRTRAQAILLSHRGYALSDIADICDVQRDTVGRWLDAFEQDHLKGLQDDPRSGAPRRFEPQEEAEILRLLDAYPHQPAKIKALIQEQTGKELTDDILSRLAAEYGYT